MLLAGLDGIENKIDPGEPMDRNLYDLPPEDAARQAHVPDSLRNAVEALRADHDFLLKGEVFTRDFIYNYCAMKMQEYDAIRLRPHPHEFFLYYDV